MIWLPVLLLAVGFIALVWSADRFLSAAAACATNLGISKMLIGLTVVSIGTSAPEILVAVFAAIDDNPLLAVGNAIGSNIANIGLVLGITAIVAPLPFSARVRKTELPWLLGATFLAIALMFDRHLSVLNGIILLAGLTVILYQLVRGQDNRDQELSPSMQEELNEIPDMTTLQSVAWLILGLIVLLISAQILVYAATEIATTLGVSEMIIGLTIVAVGTSLPELAATIGSAIKGHTDIAIGNVVGSNILNILAVLAVPSIMAPTDIDFAALWRDCGMMLALTLMLALFAYGINSRPVITRFEGAVMLMAWIGYNVLLVQQA
ncbi:MAG: calcium/sodium antiporter [Pseudomonadales bacterium]|nr:calcium/sodium antiporter [Pseudomonadales bacterium]